jgi:hypothetical protein
MTEALEAAVDHDGAINHTDLFPDGTDMHARRMRRLLPPFLLSVLRFLPVQTYLGVGPAGSFNHSLNDEVSLQRSDF